ncbi:MAG: type I-E CRISPR-associated protein Cse2/CasB [Synergistaceae bacterium]|jgi:CRISPR type I-E-associated protein CasB/Cse2|nr:type I-E CRISPR-associated protein Cse2/CasB [Synergistaceae bacterium]
MIESGYLKRLEILSKGQSASLRRSAGKSLREADARALGVFYASVGRDIKPQTPQWQEDMYFAVGCLYCMWRPEERKNPKPFAECVFDLGQNDGLDARFRALLDTDWHETDFLSVKLYRLTRRIKAEGGFPDFKSLLKDLMNWNCSKKHAQLKWARQYFQQKEMDEDAREVEQETDEENK